MAERAFQRQLANSYALHKLYYYEVRETFDLPANIAILTFAQVAANYKRDKSKKVSFRPLAAIPYRQGAFRYKGLERLNIKTADGQRHDIPMVMGDYQAEQFGHVELFAELVRRKDGQWFLMATVEQEPEPPCDPDAFLGVDLGVENLATDSDGEQHSGKDVERVRVKTRHSSRLFNRRPIVLSGPSIGAALFCHVDDFCQAFKGAWSRYQLTTGRRRRADHLCLSEIMTGVDSVMCLSRSRPRRRPRFLVYRLDAIGIRPTSLPDKPHRATVGPVGFSAASGLASSRIQVH